MTEPSTPVVVIDESRLDANIARVQASATRRGLGLRPHAKTHKIPQIAARQIAAGARGLTVATIGEAEVFAAGGARSILIAYPLFPDAAQLERLVALAGSIELTLGTDSAEAALRLAPAVRAGAAVWLELDSGHHRSGVAPEQALDIATEARAGGVEITGLFTFPGHSYAPGAPSGAAAGESAALSATAEALRAAGFTIEALSGGSTPSAEEETAATEIRPGVYVFGDAQQWELGTITPEQIALSVHATVVSVHEGEHSPRRILLDAGSKTIGADRPGWATGHGRLIDHPEARITAVSEHHATVEFPEGAELPRRGERLRVVPNHVCQTLNLVDEVWVAGPDGIPAASWVVAARGRNS